MFCRWTNQGSRKNLQRTYPQYLKFYYYIKADGKSSKANKKEVYFPVENHDEVCIVNYLGDAAVSELPPYGNWKKTQLFFRTKPCVVHDLEQNTEPINLKQLHNIRAAFKEEIRLSRDAIYSTHEIAYERDFVHYLSTYPDLYVVGEKR